ncbi:hypothetical protein CHS0354_008985 [Potamilus streckersoni]|uniref:Hairy/enhancer-of-split related with YRPW motif protein n=1 Tax=Potamilus streckersoni TaxID=2493646 RepID=A0AAE0THP8_9BIVA|nr:hypothetical protein CHS0354_008985 [Potamilus streckersoni]
MVDISMDLDGGRTPKRIKLELVPAGDRPLNFSTTPDDVDFGTAKKQKTIRDPMSHRIIEKRRRDRMNNCLADLSKLIPPNFLKQGQGRIEKTEIIEMAIKHIKNLTGLVKCQEANGSNLHAIFQERFYLGFKECQAEMIQYLVEVEGWDVNDQVYIRMMTHLEQVSQRFYVSKDRTGEETNKEPVPLVLEDRKEVQYQFSPNIRTSVSSNVTAPIFIDERSNGSYMNQDSPSLQDRLGVDNTVSQHISHDQHLRTLLVPSQGQAETAYVSGSDGNECCLPSLGSCISKNEGDKSSELSSDYRLTSPGSGISNSKEQQNVYKFKHNITKRFSQENRTQNQQSDSSSSSKERNIRNGEKPKRSKFQRYRSCSPNSDSTPYPNSESSGTVPDPFLHSSHSLPAFVLHPSGTHYMPLSIHPSFFRKSFDSNTRQSQVFHPISIPVNFGGPLVTMRKMNIRSHNTSPSINCDPSSDTASLESSDAGSQKAS